MDFKKRLRQPSSKQLKAAVAILVPLFILLIPLDWIPIAGLTVVEQRVIAIFFAAALLWVLEPIPIYATSILVIFLELLLISDTALLPFREGPPGSFGELMHYKDIMATLASPIILLFLGGFFLAIAATKYGLDVQLAAVLLRPFGANPSTVMLGLMSITALFSMFMSNTAATAMMLSILSPILREVDRQDRGRAALVLAIPFAANLGGLGTPIGSPPNAIGLNYIDLSFGQWMMFAVPFVAVILLVSWLVLRRLFPFEMKEIRLKVPGKPRSNFKTRAVYITFGATILLWLTDVLHGINSYTIALVPVAVFLVLNIINKEDLKQISWEVLWLVSGGIALGLAMERTGLAEHLVHAIDFSGLTPAFMVLLVGVVALVMANFMSHTATANLLLPIVSALGVSLPRLAEWGGSGAIVLMTTFACSLGMSLPISTPPNALAHATGEVKVPDMTKAGVLIGGIGLVLFFLMLLGMNQFGFFAHI